ncbi:MAG: hypothetical protein IKV43_03160 [Clostridia bacterium]|nr:hypothetical protein [Clostridia bacterium]
MSDGAKQKMDAIIDLDTPYILYDLKLYDFNNTNEGGYVFCGNKLIIEVYNDGKWTEVVNWTGRDEIISHRVSDYILVPLNGVRAEKLRIYIPETYTGPDKNGTVKTQTISYYEFKCSGREDIYTYESVDNAFAGKTFVPTSEAAAVVHNGASSAYGYPTLTDGKTIGSNVHNGRFSTASTAQNQHLDATLDLEGTYLLNELRIQEFQSGFAGGDLTVQVYYQGTWTTVIYLASEAEIKAHSTKASDGIIKLDLGGVLAEKVRLYISKKGSSSTISIWEIQCSGTLRQTALKVDRTAFLESLNRLPASDRVTVPNWNYLYNADYERFMQYATDFGATQDEIDAYTAEINAFADTVTSLGLTAYNISFGGDISMNFRYTVFDAETLAAYPNAFVRIILPAKDGTTTLEIAISDLDTDDAGRYVIPVKLNASQLADKVALTIVYEEGKEGPVRAYSVRDYADHVLANSAYETAYPGINNLLRAMLNYGAFAQEYFDYNSDNLANTGIYTTANNPVLTTTVTVSDSIAINGSVNGIAPSGWMLSLLSKTTARFYFNLADGHAISEYTFTVVKPNGEEITVTPAKDGERYRIDVADIGAAELDETYTILVSDGTDTARISFTALCYASTVLGGGSSNPELINLAKALKLYSDAANAYADRNS